MNVYEAVVTTCDPRASHAWLAVGRGHLAVRRWDGMRKGMKAQIAIRPEDIVLCADAPGRVSARNVLPGHVHALKSTPEGVYVTADVGFLLTALITRSAVSELQLRRGASIFAIVKATAIVPHVEVEPRLSVSVVGRHGSIEARQIAFLRALSTWGSMLGAGRSFGVSYRTAWLWVKGVNHAWGGRLVVRVHGGRGGGGARLTPEGLALLNRVEQAERRINAIR